MIEIITAHQASGTIVLPPNPDCFALTALLCMAANTPVNVTPVEQTPLIEYWQTLLRDHLSFQPIESGLRLIPQADVNAPLELSMQELRFREFFIFCALGMGKTITLDTIAPKRLEQWTGFAKRAHCQIDIQHSEQTISLRLPKDTPVQLPEKNLCPEALHAFLGLAVGRGIRFGALLDYSFSSPLRTLLPAFGYHFQLKGTAVDKPLDPIARRIQRMQPKKKEKNSAQEFRLSADFSRRNDGEPAITLPGDDILGALFITLKALVQKGNLIIEQMPLESWAGQTLAHVRKMGCSPGVQEHATTSLGSCGMIQLQRFSLSGRKLECSPFFHFEAHIGAILVMAMFTSAQSVVRGMQELRANQPDDIERIAACLKTIGVHFGEMPDGFVIKGTKQYDGFDITQELPAALAGALAIAGTRCIGKTTIMDQALNRRWPDFLTRLDAICQFKKSESSPQ